jgi:hypothetical protein
MFAITSTNKTMDGARIAELEAALLEEKTKRQEVTAYRSG